MQRAPRERFCVRTEFGCPVRTNSEGPDRLRVLSAHHTSSLLLLDSLGLARTESHPWSGRHHATMLLSAVNRTTRSWSGPAQLHGSEYTPVCLGLGSRPSPIGPDHLNPLVRLMFSCPKHLQLPYPCSQVLNTKCNDIVHMC
jgi:hypothetical protein